jgi:hypothetical protein
MFLEGLTLKIICTNVHASGHQTAEYVKVLEDVHEELCVNFKQRRPRFVLVYVAATAS